VARVFARAFWEFVVGDDWPTAVGVVLSLAVTALVATSDLATWWVMPLAALALLRWSVLRRVRSLSRLPTR
jgi:hypothetical protein